ncbi:alpha-ketoglutarate-dependent dioxygenase AlkB [Gillisia sp. M10.2A]|uniref:Alpha-ketoglutarate-dependent dioxygenase AlkB n=1 Tax=Gillisia lutea TaxID=2909668 RepID=A0ABS9EJ37_9FLAO|nr:alpha-ketoglutarate-dependent dioxygenase AlkB [Gillisia lutea]MCF4101879.1 alpha-ketoglutarate-dependent dioxygenase AlkB [Gillisia lutea]
MTLPINCKADYINNFLSEEEANELYATLINTYKLDKARLIIQAGDKLIETDSFKILFATEKLIKMNTHPEEVHGKCYVYKGALLKLKKKVETNLNKEFELAMCLYYPYGNYFAPHHSDQETFGSNTILPSIRLGEVREFSFYNKTNKDVYNLDLAHGSLLVMGDHCQTKYTHSLPKNPKYKNGRINITFREPNFQ